MTHDFEAVLTNEDDIDYNHSQDEAIYTPLTHSDKPV